MRLTERVTPAGFVTSLAIRVFSVFPLLFFLILSSVFLSALLFPASAVAQEEETPTETITEEVVVTATRTENSIDTVGSSISVINAEEIEQRQKTTVLELLRTVPGLEVSQGGGAGRLTSVFLRGASSAQTLVLVDGVRANSTTGGSMDISNLRADGIERIEVVRGPQSTLYGSEAIGGVVNIVTRRSDGEEYQNLDLSAGNDAFAAGRVNLGGGNERVVVDASLAHESSDGISAASERLGNTEADAYEILNASVRLDVDLGSGAEAGRLDFTARYTDTETDLDGFDFFAGVPIDDPNFMEEREALYTSIGLWKPIHEKWHQSVTVTYADDQLVGSDPDSFFNNYDITSQNLSIVAQADLFLYDDDVLTVGYHYEDRRGENPGAFEEEVELSSFFIQDQWNARDWFFLTLGARYDDHSQFGDETTYRVTAALLAGKNRATRLHGTYGTGFRAPSLNELYFPFFGNLDLLPETSESFDLGVEHRFESGFSLHLTYFSNDFEDLIGFDFTTFLANNIADAESSGVEAVLRYAPSGESYDITATYTYTDSEDKTLGTPLPRIPETKGTLLIGLRPGERLSGSVSFMLVQDRIDSDGSVMDDYERVDVSFAYRISDLLRPYLRVENLFDEDYEEVNGFTSPGATFAAGLRLKF